jgi:hypothetical protein
VLSGVEAYDGFVEVDGCRFAEFTDLDLDDPMGPPVYGVRKAAGLTQVAKTSTWSNDPRNVVRACEFGTNVSRTAYLRDPISGDNQIAFTFIVDEDDSLGYGADVMLFPNVDFLGLDQPLAVFHPDALPPATGLNGYVVPARNASAPTSGLAYGQMALKVNFPNPNEALYGDTTWTPIFDPAGAATAGSPWTSHTVPVDTGAGGSGNLTFPVSLEIGDPSLSAAEVRYYAVDFPNRNGHVLPASYDLWLRFTPNVDDVVYLEIPYDQGTDPGQAPSIVRFRNPQSQFFPAELFSPAPGEGLDEFISFPHDQAWWHVDLGSGVKVLRLKLTALTVGTNQPFPEGVETYWEIRP